MSAPNVDPWKAFWRSSPMAWGVPAGRFSDDPLAYYVGTRDGRFYTRNNGAELVPFRSLESAVLKARDLNAGEGAR